MPSTLPFASINLTRGAWLNKSGPFFSPYPAQNSPLQPLNLETAIARKKAVQAIDVQTFVIQLLFLG